MPDVSQFDKIKIGIASSEDIRSWSKGEVKKPETINYRTFKPEREGLFCEKIFGPTRDWECSCGKYKKIKYKGMVCERCGVEVTRSKVRRERMGHVDLAAPVCHIWYLKNVPSPISLILDITPKLLDKVVSFSSFIIIDIEKEKISEYLPKVREEIEREKIGLQAESKQLELEALQDLARELSENADEYADEQCRERAKLVNDRIKAELRDMDARITDLDFAVEALDKLEKNTLIEEDKYRAVGKLLDSIGDRLKVDLRSLVRANIGAEAVKELLTKVDLETLARSLRIEIVSTLTSKRARAIKRLAVVEALLASKSRPEWMVLDIVPVISPELRPMVQLDGGRFATSDLNDLYRRIINRNNRLKRIIEIHAPESIINHEKRLLQEAVDALIDNGRRQRPVTSASNNRPLKSLSDMLKGKEGRFRKNLLGKRVDYSGRSVIVVGPHLKLHQCGLPKEMALELFKPFVMKVLVDKKITQNVKTAKKMIERMHPQVWDSLEQVIKEHPVLLNRAPTLHRLGIQAFEPILVDGKAIQVHPLVCNMYNADFDGDQMAVHVPLSTQAQSEARVLMLSTQNLFSPADGRPTNAPVQDIILGSYAITFVSQEAKKQFEEQEALHNADPEKNPPLPIFSDMEQVLYCLESPNSDLKLQINQPVKVRITRPVFRPDDEIAFRDPATGQEYIEVARVSEYDEEYMELQPLEMAVETVLKTVTPGQIIFNKILPFPLRFSDHCLHLEMGKKQLAEIINRCHARAGVGATIKLLDDIKELGFKWATKYGLSVAITDMDPPERREEILTEADKKSNEITKSFRRGMSNYNEMTQNLTKLWSETYDSIGKEIVAGLTQFNPLNIITVSGARGSIKQVAQLTGMRGLMLNQFNEVIYELPVKSSFHKGLTMLEYFVTTHGARKGLADTALRTADAGYLTRRLCDVSQDVIVNDLDCGTTNGVLTHRILDEGEVIENLGDRIFGRISLATIVDPVTNEEIIKFDEIITKPQAELIRQLEKAFLSEIAPATTDEAKEKVHAKYVALGFIVDERGELCVEVRSPLTCELSQGICSKCYGIDLSTFKLVEVGLSVGIIAAQSVGEPGTQLTMRTFHTGGVAGSAAIARTKQFKTGKFVRQFMDDFASATDTDMKNFDSSGFLKSQEKAVRACFANPEMAPLTINDEPEPTKKVAKHTKAEEKRRERDLNESKKIWERTRKTFFYAWTGQSSGIVRVEEIFEARKQPRGKAIICPVSGIVKSIDSSSFGRFLVVETTVPLEAPIKDAYISDDQPWAKGTDGKYNEDLAKHIGQRLNSAVLRDLIKHEATEVRLLYPNVLPPQGQLPVQVGSKVIKGDPLTQGPCDPHEVLELAGAMAVYDYFIENLQSVYKSQGVDINDKHIEVIIRQMLRKRKVKEPGDTPFLPGQTVDRFALSKANDKVRDMIHAGTKIRYTDPITQEEVERDPKEATAYWELLGITEAALNTESFLSAASFQKTTKVLTEAAVQGKRDQLVGLKENVIIGRLIPSGTGVRRYRDISIEAKRGPKWIDESLTALVEAEDREDFEGDLASIADLQSDDGDLD